MANHRSGAHNSPVWKATLRSMARTAIESMCKVTEDGTLPGEVRAAAAQYLKEAQAEGRVPDALAPRVTGALKSLA